jgi:hypothetical protein
MRVVQRTREQQSCPRFREWHNHGGFGIGKEEAGSTSPGATGVIVAVGVSPAHGDLDDALTIVIEGEQVPGRILKACYAEAAIAQRVHRAKIDRNEYWRGGSGHLPDKNGGGTIRR